MTTTPAELERKVRRLDHDVQSIYELLASISATQARHGNRLDEIDVRLETIEARFDTVEGRFDSVTTSLDQILTLLRER